MRVTCPACGAELTLDALFSHDEARRAVAAAMQISAPLAWRLMKYLALFRPERRQLTMQRVAALLDELLPMIRDARVPRGVRTYTVTVDDWKQALDTVLANRDAGTLRLPLKGHGYLLEVATAMVERFEAAEEEKRERVKRQAHRDLTAEGETVDIQQMVRDGVLKIGAPTAAPASGPRAVPSTARHALDALGFHRRSPSPPPSPPAGGEGEGEQA